MLGANKRRRSPVCGADTAPHAASSKWSAARLPSRRRLSLAATYVSLKTWKQTSIKRKWFPVLNSSLRQASSLSNSDEERRALTQRCLKSTLPALVRPAAWNSLQSQKTRVLGARSVCSEGVTRPSHSGRHSGIFMFFCEEGGLCLLPLSRGLGRISSSHCVSQVVPEH